MVILDTAASMAEMVLPVFYLAAPVSPRASNQAKTHLHHLSHAISHQTTPHMQFLKCVTTIWQNSSRQQPLYY